MNAELQALFEVLLLQKIQSSFLFESKPMLFFLQWRLKTLWSYLLSVGLTQDDLDQIQREIEAVVIKSIICSYKEMQDDFRQEFSLTRLSLKILKLQQ